MIEGQKNGLHHILHIHKGDVLRLVAHGKINVLLDAFGHQEVVFLAWTIHASGPKHDERQHHIGYFAVFVLGI